jgi:HK97 family phage major capsid protein
VERLWGAEILEHSTAAVDLTRARDGLPLLASHDTREMPPVGKVENVRLSGKQLRGTLRFAPTARGRELFQAVRDGFAGAISIGYEIKKMVEAGTDRATGRGVYRAIDWAPFECSLVNVPADTSVGAYRSAPQKEPCIMAIEVTPDPAAEAERFRVHSITSLGGAWKDRGGPEMALRAVAEGSSLEDFRRTLVERLASQSSPAIRACAGPEIGESADYRRELERYSLCKAILALTSGDWREAGREREIGEDYGRRTGVRSEGIVIPLQALVPRHSRALSQGSSAAGGYLVQTDLLANQFIDVLRAKSQVVAAGATTLPGLTGNVAIPRKASGSTAYWLASETSDITPADPAFAQMSLSPKTVGALTEFSRKLLLQATPEIEMLVQQELVDVIGTAIDAAVIAGTGSGGQPSGITTMPAGIGAVVMGAAGAALTHAKVVEHLADVAVANADSGSLAWIVNAKTQAKLMVTLRDASYGVGYLWGDAPAGAAYQGVIAGKPAFVSNNVPSNLVKGGSGAVCSATIYGNWADVIVGLWGGLELLADPYTKFASGAVRVRAMASIDTGLRHPESFAVSLDVLTA